MSDIPPPIIQNPVKVGEPFEIEWFTFQVDENGAMDPKEKWVRHSKMLITIELSTYDALKAELEELKGKLAWKSLGADVLPDQANIEGLLADRDQLMAENESLRKSLTDKVLFEPEELREANSRADGHLASGNKARRELEAERANVAKLSEAIVKYRTDEYFTDEMLWNVLKELK